MASYPPCFDFFNSVHEKQVSSFFRTRTDQRRLNNAVLEYKNNIINLPRQEYSTSQILSGHADTWFLRKGDQIKFSDGSKVTLADYLGAGSLTQVFAIEGNSKLVVGLPSRPAGEFWSNVLKDYRLYEQTAERGREAGYPIIRTYSSEGIVFRERLSPFKSFLDFGEDLKKIPNEQRLSPEQKEKLEAAFKLIEFLKGRRDGLTDIRKDQIAWRKHEWIFVDFRDFMTNETIQANGFTQLNTEIVYNLYLAISKFPSARQRLEPYIAEHERYVKWRDQNRGGWDGIWF